MRAPTIKAFSHANLVGCTVSVSRPMSRRSLRTGVSIFQIYLSTGRHWIGGGEAGKVVSVQRNIFWRENIGDDQTYIFSVVWSSLLHTEINF
jgi:hypothetical protein